MPSITKELIEKHNKNLANGYMFDAYNYMLWGRKNIIRKVKFDGDKVLHIELRYDDSNYPVVEIGRCREQNGMLVYTFEIVGSIGSSGSRAYKKVRVGEQQKRKTYSVLEKLSAIATNGWIAEHFGDWLTEEEIKALAG